MISRYSREQERHISVTKRAKVYDREATRAPEKSNGGVRVVSNLMALNDFVEGDRYVLLKITDVVRAKTGSEWFTVIDLKEGC